MVLASFLYTSPNSIQLFHFVFIGWTIKWKTIKCFGIVLLLVLHKWKHLTERKQFLQLAHKILWFNKCIIRYCYKTSEYMRWNFHNDCQQSNKNQVWSSSNCAEVRKRCHSPEKFNLKWKTVIWFFPSFVLLLEKGGFKFIVQIVFFF